MKKTLFLGSLLLASVQNAKIENRRLQVQDNGSPQNVDNEDQNGNGQEENFEDFECSNQCQAYSNERECIVCFKGNYLNRRDICKPNPENCAIANKAGRCRQCDEGFYVGQNTVCQELPENCKRANRQGQCRECTEEFYLANGEEGLTCQELPENCKRANRNGVCRTCDDGFYRDRNRECQELPENCQEANARGQCTKCSRDFKEIDGACSQIVCTQRQQQQCNERNQETGVCTGCVNRQFLGPGNCCTLVDGNCRDFIFLTGECTQCYGGYKVSKRDNKVCILETTDEESVQSNGGDNGDVDGDNGDVDGDNGDVDGDNGDVDGDNGDVDGDNGDVDGDNGDVDGDNGDVDGDNGDVDGDNGDVDGDNLQDGQGENA